MILMNSRILPSFLETSGLSHIPRLFIMKHFIFVKMREIGRRLKKAIY